MCVGVDGLLVGWMFGRMVDGVTAGGTIRIADGVTRSTSLSEENAATLEAEQMPSSDVTVVPLACRTGVVVDGGGCSTMAAGGDSVVMSGT